MIRLSEPYTEFCSAALSTDWKSGRKPTTELVGGTQGHKLFLYVTSSYGLHSRCPERTRELYRVGTESTSPTVMTPIAVTGVFVTPITSGWIIGNHLWFVAFILVTALGILGADILWAVPEPEAESPAGTTVESDRYSTGFEGITAECPSQRDYAGGFQTMTILVVFPGVNWNEFGKEYML